MNLDIQTPGIAFLVILPAILVVATGSLLKGRLNPYAAAAIAAALPGLVLVVLALVDEGNLNLNGLVHLPVGWAIWTLLGAPGLLLGFALLFVPRLLRRRTGLD